MKLHRTLFARIVLWFFLTMIVMGAVLFGAFKMQFRFGPQSVLGHYGQRVVAIGRLIAHDLEGGTPAAWNEVLERYRDAYGVDFILCAHDGGQLAGAESALPAEVLRHITAPPRHGLPGNVPRHPPPPDGQEAGPEGGLFTLRTDDPRRYWVGVRIPLVVERARPPHPATLLAVSSSVTGGGLFLDAVPWLVLIAVVLFLSVVIWFPLVRSITRPIGQITRAADEIAHGRFDVKLDEGRTDEIGLLGHSINEMASRLDGLLKGQKRFLGDVAHELASPAARIQLGLGALEQRVDDVHKDRVRDVIEDAQHMSKLVNELLSFSRAQINPAVVALESVALRPLVERVCDREASGRDNIDIDIDEKLAVMADSELLSRALANIVRNAERYAGEAGPILISARGEGGIVHLQVSDDGPGVAESELSRLFEPFSRPDSSRERETGGVGLGLAIVKTCVEACGGTVRAENRKPHGLTLSVSLNHWTSV
ncbi:MAG: HAMP domain-containing sensor histidine kinase [Candidatus Lernaella stagnicola]|nr:HAMP domain-containing sensor histidine kinase [Candidatus Lernaella stagnicola]